MRRNSVDVHNSNPCGMHNLMYPTPQLPSLLFRHPLIAHPHTEELNYHGPLPLSSTTTNPLLGSNYGYPDCFGAWNTTALPSTPQIQVGTQFSATTSTDNVCKPMTAPRLCLPPHTAPLGIAFTPDGTAAYIALHGSWNRSPPDGYRVSKVVFDAKTGQPVEPATSLVGAVQVFGNKDLGKCPGGCVRPVEVRVDKGGRLFVSSDATGEVWVLGGV